MFGIWPPVVKKSRGEAEVSFINPDLTDARVPGVRVDGPGQFELGYPHTMMIRSLARWLLAPLACWLVIAPTIAGVAHERAHEAIVGDHDFDHDHGGPDTGSDQSASGDHADSEHQAARIGSGLSTRADLAIAADPPIGDLRAEVITRLPVAFRPLDLQPDQTHHPPGLPRAPPRS